MIDLEKPTSPLRLVLAFAGVIVILAGLHFGAQIVNLVLLSLLITLVALPLRRRLKARGFSSRGAYVVTLCVILAVSALIVLIAIFSFAQAAANVPQHSQEFQEQSSQLASTISAATGIDISSIMAVSQDAATTTLESVASIAENFISMLVFLGFLLLVTAFMLAEADGFGRVVQRAVGADNPAYRNTAGSISAVVTYFIITARINAMIAIGDIILLWLIGVPYPILWGVVSFIFGFIPYVGYWVSILPPLILAFGAGGIVSMLMVVLGYWLINGVFSQLVAPRMYGKGLDLSVTLTVIVVLFWGWLLGPIGGILAVPLTAIIKSALLASYSETAWLATVLGDSTTTSAQAAEEANKS